jgi:alginate O-acetyltransferase complex protein AlgJ
MKSHATTRTTGRNREEQARREIGHTDVSRFVAVALTAAFLVLHVFGFAALFATPALRGALAGLFDRGGALKARIDICESTVNREFPAAAALREPVQMALIALGAGDEQVVLGREGWLFYRPDVTALTGRGLDVAGGFGPPARREPPAIASVKAFHDALAARGVRLVLQPTPVKPGVHADKLRVGGAAPEPDAVVRARGYATWSEALRAQGCEIFDAAPILAKARAEQGDVYLKGDTHWRPETMDRVAAALAGTLRNALPASAAHPVEAAPRAVTNVGDTATMLALPATHALRAPESVVVRPVERATDAAADVVLLGDSFANIYSLESMGWGADAGLAERLAFHLGRPVKSFVRNDGGAWSSRERFAQALARGTASLDGVKVVVWQFAERELVHGEWKMIALPESAAQPSRPRDGDAADPGGTAPCTATVAAVSTGPRLDAPYSEFIIKWHVTGLAAAGGATPPGEAVVLLYGMRARNILPAASIQPGMSVSLKLRPWSEVEGKLGSLNAGLLDDEMLEIDLPLYWAEESGPERQ